MNEKRKLCKEELEEIQAIKNTLRKYDDKRGTADTFWETFNSSRCKTSMLVISIIVTLVYGITVILGVPNGDLTVIVMGIIGFWSGRSSKAKDRN